MKHYEVRPIAEVPLEEVPSEEFEIIKSALNNGEFRYRTISGIHKDTGVQSEHIAAVLDHSGLARRTAYVKEPGQAVYAPAEAPKTFRERIAEARWLLTH